MSGAGVGEHRRLDEVAPVAVARCRRSAAVAPSLPARLDVAADPLAAARRETSGPIWVSGSSPAPSLIVLAMLGDARRRPRRTRLSWTNSREPAQQHWPWLKKMPLAAPGDRRPPGRRRRRRCWGLAAQLQGDLLQVARRGLHDQLADLGGAGEGDLSTSVGGQRRAGRLAEAGDDVDHAGGKPASAISSPSRSAVSGVCSAGLSTTVLPVASAGPELPGRHQQREVPGDDLADHADRLAQGVGVEFAPGA